ncbi:acyl-CoA dehydrogenase family protein [Novosphingobium aquimarinum]|uniref:acyl-CoA dehydrogenase family protein n=1 Tax=Novosphingobium aquimarinum TaxID=2682494 RepID=UPI0012EC55DC|nr:acyl-CoA dehydrogenase family protein [Novosphingobium aquimarinum]
MASNLQSSADDERRLVDEVRKFCETIVPSELREKVAANGWLERDEYLSYYRLLARHELLIGHWPIAYGGRGWSARERMIFERETAVGYAPWLVPMAVGHVGPVLYTFGTDAQKQRFLPPIAQAQIWWSQGYSEPGAGSDLASLKTRAVRDGDHYVVTGQKIWTSYAQWGDWLYCLVKTGQNEKPQASISFLLIDLRSPGIEIRPIVSMDMMHHLNEVFLDEVRVPVANLVGREGQGWEIAKFLLNNERMLVAEPGKYRRQLRHLHALTARSCTMPSSDRAVLQTRIAELELRLFTLNALFDDISSANGAEATASASMLKIRGARLEQDIAESLFDCLGSAGMIFEAERTLGAGRAAASGIEGADGIIREHLYTRATTIFGGTNEIQYNILAKALMAT